MGISSIADSFALNFVIFIREPAFYEIGITYSYYITGIRKVYNNYWRIKICDNGGWGYGL
jgi:hypothetical protein